MNPAVTSRTTSALRRTLLTPAFARATTPNTRTLASLSTARQANNNNNLSVRQILAKHNPNPSFRSFATTPRTMGVHNIEKKAEWDSALAEKDTLMVVDCFATWCGPCKVIAPQVVKYSDEYPNAKFYKIDVDELPDVAQELGIRAMPTFLLFKNGERVGEIVGANPKALQASIEANL